ncbi:MAG: glycosyltransferase family 4 protein, partial [Flavobacteriaceae bacterium]|nr:glycosyltransferase family 4 protein [Flavobacteriaceae bacterium]
MKVQKLKDSKRILIVSSEFPPQPGGIGNHAWNLANQLSIYGLDVTVFTDSRGTKLDEEITFDAAQAFTLKRVARKKPLILTYLNRLLSVRKLLKSSKPDVLILSGKFSVWMSVFFRKTCKVFVVVHGSELNLKNKIGSRLLNLGLQKCDKIIAVSNFTKSLLEERFQKKATVIFNGFRPIIGQIEKTAVKKDTVLNLITVGSLSQRKGQHNVIKALPILKKSFEKIHYHMVGAPVIQEDLQQLAYKLGVLDNVTFHGVVNDEELGVLL